tara:strand:- start:521 stop:1861 length:1341 start_codon:yes stop_codon:yes gene_type:complete
VYCGHPEIETALVELYRVSGSEPALRLAEAFIRRRGSGFIGNGDFGSQYYQDDVGVLETNVMRGHAVRALYLNTGVTDVCLETGDAAQWESLQRQWDDLVAHRLYITGGTGSRHRDEAFGDAYELPSERAYAETCAGIALVGWAWRMYLNDGQKRYLDVLERCLYNVVLAGVSREGDKFFYSNPLQLRSDHGASQQESAGSRLGWYACACCPPNIMRVFATLEHLMFARRGHEIQVANFGNATVPLPGDSGLLKMSTAFPSDGQLTFTVEGDPGGATLAVRVPDWADGRISVRVDGVELKPLIEAGWLRVGALKTACRIDIDLPMAATLWRANPGVDALRGSTAIIRGPLVYCADQVDNIVDIERVVLVPGVVPRTVEGLNGEIAPLLHLEVRELDAPASALALYERATDNPAASRPSATPLVLRPYATWGNGAGVTAMKIWLPET